ncbi:unnamed protein product [Ambrosiozyma monospora]|uniref:Unnamed protein product n=1 Tax=Ambrosiozyma monospora TaxID=43982 RepID=A0ACB5SYH4_AMBMO|nr:unnamed protein product [Ambrosiozyma monospora]
MEKATSFANSINRGLILTLKYKKQPQLFLHSISSNTTKVSFSKDPESLHIGSITTPKLTSSSTSTSSIPGSGISIPTEETLQRLQITTSNFTPNRDFLTLLQNLFSTKVKDDMTYQIDALNYPLSYMAIADLRAPISYMNQRADLEDTFGFVHVDQFGEIVDGTYEPSETYRLCGYEGIIKLSDFMCEEVCKAID